MTEPPRMDADGYERVDSWTETAFEAPYLIVQAHNAVYEDPDERERFAPVMTPGVDQSPRARFTTGLSFSRPPPGDRTTEALLGIAARFARREFRADLERDGLRDPTEAGTHELRVGRGRRAEAFAFDAAYPLAGQDRTLSVRVWAAIWPTTDAFAMAGGIFPTESLRLDGGALRVSAEPAGDRTDLFAAIRDAAR